MNETKKSGRKPKTIKLNYFDRTTNEFVEIDCPKKVKRYLKSSAQKIRRQNNSFEYHTERWDDVFNDSRPENDVYRLDPNSNPEDIYLKKRHREMMKVKKEHYRTLVENALCCLTPEQREVIDLTFYENMSEREIGKKLGISQPSVNERKKNAIERLKNYIFDTQN